MEEQPGTHGTSQQIPERTTWASVVRRHPVITAILVGCTLVGAFLGVLLLTGEWSLLRRLLAGAVAGAGTGLLITATKMYD